MEEQCKRCSSKAEYICICTERHLCDTCLLSHVSNSSHFSHRPVSLSHPLLTLILSQADEVSESSESSDQIQKLQIFKEKSIVIVEKKIKQLLDQQEKNTLRKSVNKTLDTLKVSEPSVFCPSPATDAGFGMKTPGVKKEDLYASVALTARSFVNNDMQFKVIIAGDTGVGKTTLLNTFRKAQKINNNLPNNNKVTGTVKVEGISFYLDLWDLTGKDKYSSLYKMCLNKAAGGIIMFDLTSEVSFWNIESRLESLKSEADVLSVIALVGNKIDKTAAHPKKRFISFESGHNYATSKGLIYDEISANNETHVIDLFKRLTKEIWARKISNSHSKLSYIE